MRHPLASTLIVCLLSLSACATPRYGSRIELFGEGTLHSSSINSRVDKVPDQRARQIRVFMGQLPTGLAIRNKQLVVVPTYHHKILGKVSTTGLSGFNEDRNSYCAISANAATMICILGGSLIPLLGFLACPCIYGRQSNSPEDIELRKAALILALQRATLAAGGNALVIESLGSTVAINAHTRQVLSTREMTGAGGYAVRLVSSP
jgi:hypothetical protein